MSRHSIAGAPPPHSTLVREVRPPRKIHVGGRRFATRQQLLNLAELATWPNGSGTIAGVLDGGSLAALVQLGLVDRADADAVGGCRYRINTAGLDLLANLGVLKCDKLG